MTTVEPTQGGSVPAVPNALNRPEGLEDFGSEDQVMPMIRIKHQEKPVFEDSLSGAQYPELQVVMLGLVKQRVLWPPQVTPEGEDTKPPLCRSYNFNEGHPSPPETFANGTTMERFPWEASGFEPGLEILPCNSCNLKDWGSHPSRDVPWCSEQHNFAMLIPYDDGNFVPCLFQIQRSGLKNSRQYLSSFANSNEPLFTVYTKITLESRKMGNNPFAVPKFARMHATEQQHFTMFTTMYRGVRDFLQTPRSTDEDTETGDMGTEVETPVNSPVAGTTETAPPEPVPTQPAPTPPQPVATAPQVPAPTPTPTEPQQMPQTAPEDSPTPAPAPQPAPAPAPAAPGITGAPAAAPGITGNTPLPQPAQPTPQAQPVQTPTPVADDDDEIPF